MNQQPPSSASINRYPGVCYRCSAPVPARAGHLRPGTPTGRVLVVHQHCALGGEEGNHAGWHHGPLAALSVTTTGGVLGVDVIPPGEVEPTRWVTNLGQPMLPPTPAFPERAPGQGLEPGRGLQQVADLLGECINKQGPVVVMDARHDLSVLATEFARHSVDPPAWDDLRVIDPLVLAWRIDPLNPAPRTLGNLCRDYGLPYAGSHVAGERVRAALEVAMAMARRHQGLAGQPIYYLTSTQRRWRRAYLEDQARRRGEVFDPAQVGSWPVASHSDPPTSTPRPRSGRSHQPWTPTEDAALRDELATTQDWETLAESHGRSPGAIHSRAIRLGLIPPDSTPPRGH